MDSANKRPSTPVVCNASASVPANGPSPAENMMDEASFVLRKSQKDRERNYNEFLARLAGNPLIRENGKTEEHPMLLVTANCTAVTCELTRVAAK